MSLQDIESLPQRCSSSSGPGRPTLERSCSTCSADRQGLQVIDTPSFLHEAQRKKPFVSPISTSVFEIFKIGIGPSSSHTVGPMLACHNFSKLLVVEGILPQVESINVELRGSLALTGIGHGTNKAVVLGLAGNLPAHVDPTTIEHFLQVVKEAGVLEIRWEDQFKQIDFVEERDVILVADELPLHPNSMICQAFGSSGACIKEVRYYSTGGGFVLTEDEMLATMSAGASNVPTESSLPIPYTCMSDLLKKCEVHGLDIESIMRKNEESKRSPEEVAAGLEELWSVMEQCVNRGLKVNETETALPGPLGLNRRAGGLHREAQKQRQSQQSEGCCAGIALVRRATHQQPTTLMDELRWLDCYVLAVMEENACMGRVVTAPTNGAAGVVPGVLTYYMRHLRPRQPADKRKGPATFLLTAAVVGILAKEHASISGAAGGCQAEVGTASAMAAAGLCAALGGSPAQVERAAEIAMEHSLGMTCDPILGLVQAPCIERNTMGATKAVNAVTLVLKSPADQPPGMMGYDDVLRVMKATGQDMDRRYRETALGGMAADYESRIQNDPELIKRVHLSMGFERLQHGTKRALQRRLTYEDIANAISQQRVNTQAISNC